MFNLEISEARKVRAVTRNLVERLIVEDRILLFVPGFAFFLLFVLTMCIGASCLAAILTESIYPLEKSTFYVAVLPLAIGSILVLICVVGLIQITRGQIHFVQILKKISVLYFSVALIGSIAAVIGLSNVSAGLFLTALLFLALAYFSVSSKGFYTCASFYTARQDLKELYPGVIKSLKNSGKSVTQISQESGIGMDLLERWKKDQS